MSTGSIAVPSARSAPLPYSLRWLLDAALMRRRTRVWWVGLSAVFAVGIVLRASAWLAFPTIATADTNAYCAILHDLENGQAPDLSQRNIGYPLFLLAARALPLALNKAVPLAQHVLELIAAALVMDWMRRQWGILAGLMTGMLMLVNAGRAIWAHYGHPHAVLCSVVPIAVIALHGCFVAPRRKRYLFIAGALWLFVFLSRDEVLLLAFTVPVVSFILYRHVRPAGRRWLALLLCIITVGVVGRVGSNWKATGEAAYSHHGAEVVSWRVLHEPSLVASPRPSRLQELYTLAGPENQWWRQGFLHCEGLWMTARGKLGLSQREAASRTLACAMECVQRRPLAYLGIVWRDVFALWLSPDPSLEWAAFSKSDPGSFQRDAANIAWAKDAWEEFPSTYEPSSAQRLFRRLAVLRPSERFAMKPLVACFFIATVALCAGLGCQSRRFARSWFLGLVCGVLAITLFYAALADEAARYRMSVEWAFFAVASLGIVLPLRALRSRLPQAKVL